MDKPEKVKKRESFAELYPECLLCVVDKRPSKGNIVGFVAMCKEVMEVDEFTRTQ